MRTISPVSSTPHRQSSKLFKLEVSLPQMSYDPSSVQSIDQLFKRETCERLCPQWQVQCHSLPCNHCTTADVDALVESVDAFEIPVKSSLL